MACVMFSDLAVHRRLAENIHNGLRSKITERTKFLRYLRGFEYREE